MGLGILIISKGEINEKLTNQVSSVEVYEKMDQPTSFKIRFMVDICNETIAAQLEENTDPGSELGILVEAKDQLICLVNGKVIKQEANLQHGGAGSWIDVEGADHSQDMDTKPEQHAREATDAETVTEILKKYFKEPNDVEATAKSAHSEDKHSLVQLETDLAFVRRLATRNGFHFWITYDSKGQPTGHFKPRNLQGEPKHELLVNLDKANIDNLQIKWDTRRPTETEGNQVDLKTKQIIGGKVKLSDGEALGAKGLPDISSSTPVSMRLSPTIDDTGGHEARSEGALRETQWFINATCKTTIDRLCNVVRHHTIVSIQGAGHRHSGKYYVTGVKHAIDPSTHVMDMELARNAWGDQLSVNDLLKKIF